MKKMYFEQMLSILNGIGEATPEMVDNLKKEIEKEVYKGQAQKDKNAEAYEAIHALIVDSLSDTPVTCGELWESIEGSVPEGITKGKVQYALTHLWQDEIVKIEGKPNTYRKA